MKRVLGSALVCAMLLSLLSASYGCSSCARSCQKIESEYGYGVQRHVVLYSASGEVTGEWEGVIDIDYRDESMADLMFFDNGDQVVKRVILNIGAGQLVVESNEHEEEG